MYSAKDCPKNGVTVSFGTDQASKCYAYEYLDALCLTVKSNHNRQWELVGGCFDDGEFAKYLPAKTETLYDFKNVRIEVRQVNDQSYESHQDTAAPYTEGTFASELCYTFSVLFIIAAVFSAFMVFKKGQQEPQMYNQASL